MDWTAPIMFGIRVILLASLIRHVKINRQFVTGSLVILLIQLVFVGWQLNSGIARPYGFGGNASSLGLGSFAIMNVHPLLGIFGAVTLGFSGSRTYLFSAAVIAVMVRDRLKIALVLLSLSITLVVAVEFDITGRFIPWDGGAQSIERRVNEYAPSNAPEHSQPQSPKTVESTLWQHLKSNPLGTGYRDYNHETGRANPHNQFILIPWELGWLTVPFGLVLLWIGWDGRMPLRFWFALIPGLLLTDEFYARPEGQYSLVLLVIGVRHYLDVWKVRE
jgi:hypothetical protein